VRVGQESNPVRVKSAGGPTRCPFCHSEVDRDRDDWVACEACLARHHEACWKESGSCAGCGEHRSLGPGERGPEERGPGERGPGERWPGAGPAAGARPAVDLDLRGRRAHFEGDASVVLLVGTDRRQRFLLRIRNETDEPQAVELRKLPPWIVAEESPPARAVAPGETATFPLAVDPSAAPFARERGKSGQGGLLGLVARGVVNGSFIVSTPDDARSVEVEAYRATTERERWAFAALVSLLIVHGLIFGAMLSAKSRPPQRRDGESEVDHYLRVRAAEECGRLAGAIWTVLPIWVAAVAAFVAIVHAAR
jgi:hypothetical protein